MELTQQQAERLAFLEKQIAVVARETHLATLLLQHCQPLVIILEAQPKPQPGTAWPPPRPDSFLTEHQQKLLNKYPGMLFHTSVPAWQVGLTFNKEKLVFVPAALYEIYEQECLRLIGWSEQSDEAWEEEIRIEDEQTGDVAIPEIPNPVYRAGVWKARQVAHWTQEEDSTPEATATCWANGTFAG